MATKILLKKSSTAGAVPLTTDLEIGEVALNLADRKLYTKNNSNAIITIGSAFVSATAPSAPATGDLWYDSTNTLLKTYNGTAWVEAGVAYSHPTQAAINADATNNGINVIDSVTVNTLGHVTAVGTRDLSVATTSAAGVMSSADKTKLDGITAGAQPNQNAFNTIAVSGQTSVVADTATDTLTLVGNNGITITTDALTDTVTITHTDSSTQASVSNTGANVIQSVTLDGNGHVTALNSVQVTPALIGAQVAGTYLTAEADTLQTVTTRGNTTSTAVSITNNTASTTTGTGALIVTGGVGIGGAVNIGGSLTVTGDLTVSGTTTTVNSNTVNIGDSIILLNSDETLAPTQNAGFEVERGTLANVQFIWNETNDAWDMGDYTLQNVRLDGGTY